MVFSKNKGFTIIELLVVIAIIGLLASVVLVSMGGLRAKARDVKRVEGLDQLRLALELYHDRYEEYPDNTDSGNDVGCWGDWDAGNILNGEADPFIQPVAGAGIMPKVPIEMNPISGVECSFRYWKQGSSVCAGCPPYAVLYAQLETDSVPAAKGDERPDCIKPCWFEGANANDYAIYLPY